MKPLALLAALMLTATLSAPAAEKDGRVFELRTSYVNGGQEADADKFVRLYEKPLREKYGAVVLGIFVPVEIQTADGRYERGILAPPRAVKINTTERFTLIAYPSVEEMAKSKQDFGNDEEWWNAVHIAEDSGIFAMPAAEQTLLPTDFSPEMKPLPAHDPRVFELRTYTATFENLPALHARFRDHTITLFAKHGMTNLAYWSLPPRSHGATNTLVYLLAHASTDAAKASFDAFRADPEWIAAKTASEAQGGGSLTTPDGVKSVFLKATDYSPLK